MIPSNSLLMVSALFWDVWIVALGLVRAPKICAVSPFLPISFGRMLSFDEFRAVQNRENLHGESTPAAKPPAKASKAKKAKEVPDLNPAADDAPKEPAPAVKKASWRQNVGEFLELNSTQYLYLILLLLDTFIAFGEISLQATAMPSSATTRILSVFQAFSTFANVFFAIELVLSYFAFGLALLGHWGYMLDTLVISCQLSWEYVGIGHQTRVLNILRVWRLFRLVTALIGVEKESNASLQAEVALRTATIASLEAKIADHDMEIKKEKESRKAIEGMLLNYKEEVDTLNEALKIAAMDIAEVGQDDDLYSLDSEQDEDDVSKGSARRALGGIISSASSVTSSSQQRAQEDKAPLFVVKEDGSYVKA